MYLEGLTIIFPHDFIIWVTMEHKEESSFS